MRQGVVFALIPMLVLLSCVDVVKTADTSPSVAVDTDTDTDADADADSDSDTDSDTDSVDQAPQAIDDEVNVDEGGALVIDVLVNDTDPNDDIDATTVSIIDPPLVGAASVSEDGTVEYTHDGSEPVVENFTYTVDDATGLTSNIAQVTITIDPQNDAPIAVDDIASATEGALTVLDLTANDTDPDDGLDFSSVVTLDAPSFGAVSVNVDGTVNYVHDGSDFLNDGFTYIVSDLSGATSNIATVDLNIIGVNDPPVANDDAFAVDEGQMGSFDIGFNDMDLDGGLNLDSIAVVSGATHGSLVVKVDGTVDYTHDGSETTSDAFTYTIDDITGLTSNLAVVNITINLINDVPTAVDDAAGVVEGSAVHLDLASNDLDDDDGLDLSTVVVIAAPANGSVTNHGDGTVD